MKETPPRGEETSSGAAVYRSFVYRSFVYRSFVYRVANLKQANGSVLNVTSGGSNFPPRRAAAKYSNK